MLCFLLNLHVDTYFQYDGMEVWVWEVVRHEDRTLMKGTDALYKKRPKSSLAPSAMEDEKMTIYEQGIRPSPDTKSAMT